MVLGTNDKYLVTELLTDYFEKHDHKAFVDWGVAARGVPTCSKHDIHRIKNPEEFGACPSLVAKTRPDGSTKCLQCTAPLSESQVNHLDKFMSNDAQNMNRKLKLSRDEWVDVERLKHALEHDRDRIKRWKEARDVAPGCIYIICKNASEWENICSCLEIEITTATNIAIPLGVTEIGDAAFRNCRSLTKVHIPDSVTEINAHAFRGCTSLESVHIPKNATIGRGAFQGCESLIEVWVGKDIPTSAFEDCIRLTSVHIPEGVKEIGPWAFKGCTCLTSVHIPEGVEEFGFGAFHGCASLESFHIPEGSALPPPNIFDDDHVPPTINYYTIS